MTLLANTSLVPQTTKWVLSITMFCTQTTSEKIGNAGSAPGLINQAPKSVEEEPAKPRLLLSVSALLPYSDLPFALQQSGITKNLGRDVDLLWLN